MSKKGIDVSHHQGVIDWNKVKAAGIEFAILRAGFGVESKEQVDSQFERNYKECKRLGIPVGAYHYSYATSPAEAKRELDFFLKIIKGKTFEYPVMFDIEDKTLMKLPNAGVALGVVGTALGGLAALGNGLWNGGNCNRAGCNNCGGECSEDHYVNRYELELQQKIAEKDSQIALRDANTYGDQKMLEMYKYFDGQFKDIRNELCRQAVVNQKTEDSFALAKQDLDCCCRRLEDKICDERRERKCADNTIITYTNAMFYPKMVAAVTTGTATTAQTLYNPLPQDNNCCGNN